MRTRAAYKVIFLAMSILCISSTIAFGIESSIDTSNATPLAKGSVLPGHSSASFHSQPYAPQRDMAVLSVMGSRSHMVLKGFQRAVLFNAMGAIVKEVNLESSDSVYVLDKIIQENKSRGPLVIKMIR